jgi:LuxR family transcriptional regulator, maltose regulon positive regulatory protein
MSFAVTKIQPPRPRPGALLERPALEARLDAALQHSRLVLICAPAGFGKTSALARQLARLPSTSPGAALAWVACDEGDTPAQLFECLIAALEPFDLPWRSDPGAMVRAASEAATSALRRQIAVQFINAIEACDSPRGVIVVDDLHRITRPEVFEFIDQLLERLSQRWCMVVATREPPPLALARLRANGWLAEFAADDLRFDVQETRALTQAAGLPGDDAARLFERTQGWPVGLRLALNAARGAGAAGAAGAAGQRVDRAMFDFIAAEVIDRLEPGLREFLLVCSVLPELDAARCHALSGDDRALRWLEQIERMGLFISSLDVSGVDASSGDSFDTVYTAPAPSWRLHDLFRDALQARLQRERPQEWRTLQLRAAALEDDPLRALSTLTRLQAWDEAQRVLAGCAEQALSRGQASSLRTMLEHWPAERREASPQLQMVRAMLSWVRWDWASGIDATRRAAAAWRAAGNAAGERLAQSYHVVALAGSNDPGARPVIDALLVSPGLADDAAAHARALVASVWIDLRSGDQRLLAPQLHQLFKLLQGNTVMVRWYEACPLPPMVGLPGTRQPLLQLLAGAMAVVPEEPTPLRGMCHVVQGWLQLWRGDVAAAVAAVEAAEADSRWLSRPVNVDSYARSLRAVLLALRGQGAQSLATMDALVTEVEQSGEPLRAAVYAGLYHYLMMRCAALVDDGVALARAASRVAAQAADARGWLSVHQRASADAYLAHCRGDLEAACAAWRALLAREHVSDVYGQVAEARLRLADALHQRGRPASEAAQALQPLFERLRADGEWGAVLMAGPTLLTRLAQAPWGDVLSAPDRAELSVWAQAAQAGVHSGAAPAAAPAHAGDRADPSPRSPTASAAGLSPRELDVLRCLAAGDSNKIIARALELSPHTVKRHVANILDKLTLESRGQAAAWFRAQAG